jgi:hypothetical protein
MTGDMSIEGTPRQTARHSWSTYDVQLLEGGKEPKRELEILVVSYIAG